MTRIPSFLAAAAALTLAGCATAPTGTDGPAGAVTAANAAPMALVPQPPSLAPSPELRAAAQALDTELRRALTDRGPARRDGWSYGTDIATLLLYAAQRGDADLYSVLLPSAQALVLNDPDDPYTAGFVLQRTRDGAKPEASGAAEALWMARALWTGASALKRDDDRALARTILDGYARHAYVLQGTWLARRSFDFATRTFANISVLPAHHADFLAEAERRGGRTEWSGFAERSYALLGRAVAPSGLLFPVIQPEVGATYPGAALELYAPNGIASLEDSCLGAEATLAGQPRIAQGLLEVVVERARQDGGRLRAFHSADDGSPMGDAPLAASGVACLVRLASALDHAAALTLLDPKLTAEMKAHGGARGRGLAPAAGPLLLAALARGAF